MSDSINEWVENAKSFESSIASTSNGVKVVRNKEPNRNRGSIIMELAEKLRPAFQNFFRDRRDLNGVLFQPAHVRAIALNYAEYIVKAQEKNNNAAA